MTESEGRRPALPFIPEKAWWELRRRFQQGIRGQINADFLQSILKVNAQYARQLVGNLRTIGLIDESGRQTELAQQWRLDDHYSQANTQIAEHVFPVGLRDVARCPNPDRVQVSNWLMRNQGIGQVAANRIAAFTNFCASQSRVVKSGNKPRLRIPAAAGRLVLGASGQQPAAERTSERLPRSKVATDGRNQEPMRSASLVRGNNKLMRGRQNCTSTYRSTLRRTRTPSKLMPSLPAWLGIYVRVNHTKIRFVVGARLNSGKSGATTCRTGAGRRKDGWVRCAPLAPSHPVDTFDSMVTEQGLRNTVQRLYRDGHYAQAVEEGYKYLNNLVKQRAGSSADGSALMKSVFSINNPVLRLNTLRSQSQKDQQLGYMEILAGSMTGIRNPRAHEHQYLDEPAVAMELLAMANHLVRLVNGATRTRLRPRATRPAPSGAT